MKDKQVFLDYDGIPLPDIAAEIRELGRRYKILTVDYYRSSPGNFHVEIILEHWHSFGERVLIAQETSCDPAYLYMVVQKGYFFIRTSEVFGTHMTDRPELVKMEGIYDY
jgi:hypothetical protein